MKTITEENFNSIYEPLKEKINQWAQIERCRIKFENYANLNTFKIIFGEDAERLFHHFKFDCDSKYQKFRTYLTHQQINYTILNFVENEDYIYNN